MNTDIHKSASRMLLYRSYSQSWSRRRNYDIYFCAGEMTAAFCEVMRKIKSKWSQFSKDDQHSVLAIITKFDNELIFELIDDSEELHMFTEAHINNLINSQI